MILAFLFALVVTEVALRVLPQFSYLHDRVLPMYEADDKRGWRLKPDLDETWYNRGFERGHISVCTDELGNRRITAPNKSDRLPEYRILLVGDSFTFGWGVAAEETFGAILQDRLNTTIPDLRICVTNAGVPGYGLENELETLKQLSDAVKPNLVVLGFTENDFENVASGLNYMVVKDGYLWSPEQIARYDEFSNRCKRYAFRHSALARLAYHARRAFRPPTARQRGVFVGYTLEILRKEPVPEVSEAIRQTKVIVGQMKDYCESRQIAFQLVSFPRSYQIFQQEFVERLRATGVSLDDFSTEILSARIRSICDELAVPYASVQAPFDEARDAGVERDTLFIHNDGHWTRRGNELAALEMLPVIERAIRESLSGTANGSDE